MQLLKKFLYTTYAHIVIFLFLRGIKLPGFRRIKSRMAGLYQKLERQKIIRDIKGERFYLQKGPLWFRLVFDKISLFLQKNKFIISIFFKIIVSLFIILIPISLFILVRGVLPVPERVPYEVPSHQLQKQSNLHVDFPYTEGNKVDEQLIKNFSVGFFPAKLHILRGVLVSENQDVSVPKVNSYPNDISTNGTLRISYYLRPSSGKQISCVLQIFDSHQTLLGQTKAQTPIVESYSKYSIRNSWRKSFTPNVIPSYGRVNELNISLSVPPDALMIKSFNPNPTDKNDFSGAQCEFVVADFSFEHEREKPLHRRGLIFIVVHSLRANTAYNQQLMPKLNKEMKNGLIFLEHRVQSNEKSLSMYSLFSSQYPNDVVAAKDNLPSSLQALGYRVGAIGAISSLTNIIPGGEDFGFHNAVVAEHWRYDGRHITELSGQWLEKYGNAPFFLYLNYNSMENPFKPPFSNLNFFQLVKNPFGLNQKQQLYKGLAKYIDDELQTLFQKLKDLGLYDAVDIILTSDHGLQLDKINWNIFSDVGEGTKGAYTSKGHSLFDEEIRVPLMIKIANTSFDFEKRINTPSAHLDLFPTIYHFAGGNPKNISVNGIDFSPAFFALDAYQRMNDILSKRKFLYIDSPLYSGVLSWQHGEPMKYIRQLAKDSVTLYLLKAPWEKQISWFEPELFTRLNFDLHKEFLRPNVSEQEKEELRVLSQQRIKLKNIKK